MENLFTEVEEKDETLEQLDWFKESFFTEEESLENPDSNEEVILENEEQIVQEEVVVPDANLENINSNLAEINTMLNVIVWFCFMFVVYKLTKFLYRSVIMKLVNKLLDFRL